MAHLHSAQHCAKLPHKCSVDTYLHLMSFQTQTFCEKGGASRECTHANELHGAYTLSAVNAQSCCHRCSFYLFYQKPNPMKSRHFQVTYPLFHPPLYLIFIPHGALTANISCKMSTNMFFNQTGVFLRLPVITDPNE